MTRIVVIGGGSYSWGPKFLRDIFATPELQGSTIVLHDLVEQRVDLVYTLARKMIEAFNLDFRLEKTLSLAAALQGADFIILTITTGRLEAMRADMEIPAAYGIRQAVGDTTGPGGLARALRNIPVVAEIARKVDELCPRAWFLNYTNPMSVLTRTICMHRTVPQRTVGLCHEFIGVRHHLASLFGVAPEQIQAKVAGINHLIWITDLYANGRRVWDEMPRITGSILAGEIVVDGDNSSVFADHAKVKSTLFNLYGALPAAGDRHIAEFFPQFITDQTAWGQDFAIALTGVDDRLRMEAGAEAWLRAGVRGEWPLAPFMQKVSGEAANKILCAARNGEPYVGIMNLPNVGQVSNLPHGAIVETFGQIDQTGAGAMTFGALPAGVQTVLAHHVNQQEMTVQAALTGDRTVALQVLLNDPLSGRLSIDQARHMLQAMLEANRRYLPQFFGG